MRHLLLAALICAGFGAYRLNAEPLDTIYGTPGTVSGTPTYPDQLRTTGNVIAGSSITTSGGLFGDGAGITGTTAMSVPTGLLTSGPLASSVLPSSVTYTTTNQGISGVKTFTSSVTLVNVALGGTGAGGNLVSGSSITTTGGLFGNSLTITSGHASLVTSTHTGAAYFGVNIATQTGAGAGEVTTATCFAGRFVISGGCSCTGGTALSSTVNRPGTVAASAPLPTTWVCEADGTAGADCVAIAICSYIRN